MQTQLQALGRALGATPRHIIAKQSKAAWLREFRALKAPIIIDGKQISRKAFIDKYYGDLRHWYSQESISRHILPKIEDYYSYAVEKCINRKLEFPIGVRLRERLKNKYGRTCGRFYTGFGHSRTIYTEFTNDPQKPELEFKYYESRLIINYRKILPSPGAHTTYLACYKMRDLKTGAALDSYVVAEGRYYEIISRLCADVQTTNPSNWSIKAYVDSRSGKVRLLASHKHVSYKFSDTVLNTDSVTGIVYDPIRETITQRGKLLGYLNDSYGFISPKCAVEIRGGCIAPVITDTTVGADVVKWQDQRGQWHYKNETLENIVKPAALALAGLKPITPELIAKTRNADTRTELIKRYGLDRLVDQAKLVDSAKSRAENGQDIPQVWLDSDYKIYDFQSVLATQVPAYYLYMANQTVKGLYHIEGVHPCCCGSLPVALAWRARLMTDEYIHSTGRATRFWGGRWAATNADLAKLETQAMALHTVTVK